LERIERSILIIEDDDLYFESLHRHFKLLADHIVHAGCRSAAMDALKLHDYDLIVIDLGLPDSGHVSEKSSIRLDVLKNIISSSPDALHIVITGRFSAKEAQACRKIGARGYFSKSQLNAPKLAELMNQVATSDFVEHSGNEYQPVVKIASYPVLSLAEEECLQWVEQRPKSMKRIELLKLMARHFSLKNHRIAEQKYKRARSKVIAFTKSQSRYERD